MWNSRFFERVSMTALGHSIPLGHDGAQCPYPGKTTELTVVDTTGLHRISAVFCKCENMVDEYKQLLRIGLFPSSETRPKTVVTFDFLETFHKLTRASKMNLYDFYLFVLSRADPLGNTRTLVRIHNQVPFIRYSRTSQTALWNPVCRVTQMWRDLVNHLRGGRAHEPGGIAATTAGQLVELCPVCPCPGYNMPDNWRSMPNQ